MPLDAAWVLQQLNRRFAEAGVRDAAGGDLSDTPGALVHLIDAANDPSVPWLMCKEGMWCDSWADRLPTTLVNIQLPHLYNKGGQRNAGFVLSPSVNRLLCAYASDGGTSGQLCSKYRRLHNECTPGCPHGHGEHWCVPPDPSRPWEGQWGCGWHPEHLSHMLIQQMHTLPKISRGDAHNELVVDSFAYVNALPSSVEAVVYPDYANADDIAFAKELHRRFLGAFDLTKAQVPLLRYTTSRRAAPAFTIVDE